MKALVASPGGPGAIELREVAEPSPKPGQALVDVAAVSLNRGECKALADAAPGWIPGWDVAGVVSRAADDGAGPPVGARVAGLAAGGGWAEQVAIDADLLGVLPDALGFEPASTLPVAGLTAYHALRVGCAQRGSRVLVTGAAGGVGRFAIQLACRQEAAEVTAVVGSSERGKGLRELGADHVSVGMPESGEYDVILESVGGESLAQALSLVAPGGSVVSYGNSSRADTTFNVSELYRRNGARLVGLLLFPELERHRSGPTDLARLADHMAHDRLDPSIDLVSDWSDAAAAVDALLARRVAGKAVLTIS